MTSDRKIEANRKNAARSTGPRTPAGKAKSRANAIRHGLARANLTGPCSEQVETLSRAIAGDASNPEVLACTKEIAGAIVEIDLVEAVKLAVLEADANVDRKVTLLDTLNRLEKLERYSERARARRRGATCKLHRIPKRKYKEDKVAPQDAGVVAPERAPAPTEPLAASHPPQRTAFDVALETIRKRIIQERDK